MSRSAPIPSLSALRQMPLAELPEVAQALREQVLHNVARTGGHLSANLGTVELTLALHRVLDTPHDRLIWDVGHQSYPHKILTGRLDRMPTLRKKGGLSGFPHREESEFDAFGTAHSSTSISAALGMAMAARLRGERRRVVAVIGDGALSAGLAYEAMNHAGQGLEDLVIVLNDNDMSISPPVGSMNQYLSRIMQGRFYEALKQPQHDWVKTTLTPLFELAEHFEKGARRLVEHETLFAKLGLNYHGPIDGHDVVALVTCFENLRTAKGPQFVHVVTTKGKGYAPAERDPITYHGPGPFDPAVGVVKSSKPAALTYTQVFGQWLCDMAQQDERLVAITPAMREGSGMVTYSKLFPDRYVDVGIAEQHALTLAAGLACEGMKPVVAIYSTFLQRGYDQLIHDVALQNLPVVLALDRAGVVGADGATHAGVFDVPFLRCVPNMAIACPSDEAQCRLLLSAAYALSQPAAVRYPRGSGPGAAVPMALPSTEAALAEVGRARKLREGGQMAILNFGSLLQPASEVAQTLDATLVDMRWVKPLDEDMLSDLAARHSRWVVVEEGARMGGAGSAVMEWLHDHAHHCEVLSLGIPDAFTHHGEAGEVLADLGLNAQGLLRSIRARWPIADGESMGLRRVV